MRPTNQMVRLTDLNVALGPDGRWDVDLTDVPYQHQPDRKKIDRLKNYFDETFVGCPTINRRPDGRLVIVDSQHRLIMLLELGYEEWACEVYDGLTLAGEAALYRAINGDRRRPTSYDMWNADLVAEHQPTLEAKAILDSYGVVVVPRPTIDPRSTNSVTSIRELYRLGRLEAVLDVMRKWRWAAHSLERPVLEGYGQFIARHPAEAGRLMEEAKPDNMYRGAMAGRSKNMVLSPGEVYEHLVVTLGVAARRVAA